MKSSRRQIGEKGALMRLLTKDLTGSTKKIRTATLFLNQFSTLLSAGVPVVDALNIIRRQEIYGSFRLVLDRIHDKTSHGIPLSRAMEEEGATFSKMVLSMIRAGERSGLLSQMLEEAAAYEEERYESKKKITGALTYPVLLIIATFFVLAFILRFVMPTFLEMFRGTETVLPLPTRALLAISSFFTAYDKWILSGILCLVILFRLSLKRNTVRLRWDRIKMRFPLTKKIYADRIIAHVSGLLGVLLKGGVPLLEAVGIALEGSENAYVASSLKRIEDSLLRGESLASAMDREDFFPKLMVSMAEIGEDTGKLDHLMLHTKKYYEKSVRYSMQQLTTILEPLLILVMAFLVGFVVLSVALPMFDMINYIE